LHHLLGRRRGVDVELKTAKVCGSFPLLPTPHPPLRHCDGARPLCAVLFLVLIVLARRLRLSLPVSFPIVFVQWRTCALLPDAVGEVHSQTDLDVAEEG